MESVKVPVTLHEGDFSDYGKKIVWDALCEFFGKDKNSLYLSVIITEDKYATGKLGEDLRNN